MLLQTQSSSYCCMFSKQYTTIMLNINIFIAQSPGEIYDAKALFIALGP